MTDKVNMFFSSQQKWKKHALKIKEPVKKFILEPLKILLTKVEVVVNGLEKTPEIMWNMQISFIFASFSQDGVNSIVNRLQVMKSHP